MDTTWKSQGEKMISCSAFLSFFKGCISSQGNNIRAVQMYQEERCHHLASSILNYSHYSPAFLAQPNSLLLSMLIDKPLGQSGNGFIRERLHLIDAPSNEALQIRQQR
jgi:hypothetical protein